jgi:hypothetical protein
MRYHALFSGLLLLTSSGAPAQTPRPVPGKIDLGEEFRRFGLTPREQGERGVCSLFAVTALAEFELARAGPPPPRRLSEEFLIWAANAASGLSGDQAMFYKAVHGLNSLGVCSDQLMPYADKAVGARKPSAAALADARRRAGRWRAEWIKRWDLKRPLSEAQLGAIKAALAEGHPVACGLRWPNDLRRHELLSVVPPAEVFDGHSIAFTGYADDPAMAGGGVFLFLNSLGRGWGRDGHGVMSYAYARAYANDAFWLRLGPPDSELPSERFEAEALAILARGRCEPGPQDMGGFGGGMWSRGKQLFCRAGEGGFVELTFVVRKAGRYRLRVLATAAPDYGKVRTALDGRALKPEFDLYSGRASPSGSLELGTHHLTAGRHRLRFVVAGKNPASDGYFFGLDAIDLLAVK